MAVRKYELTDTTKTVDGHILHQIKNLNTGELGGWIEKEENLSQNRGSAWVSGNACVYDNARVYGNAQVSGNAEIFGNAQVSNRAKIYDNAKIGGGMEINGDVEIGGDVKLVINLRLTGDIKITTSLEKFIDDIWGDAPVFAEKDIYGSTGDEWGTLVVNFDNLQQMLDYIGDDLMRCDIFANLNHGDIGRDLRYVIYDDPDAQCFNDFGEDTLKRFVYTFIHFKDIVLKEDTL